jgi:hypothetical protein
VDADSQTVPRALLELTLRKLLADAQRAQRELDDAVAELIQRDLETYK